MDSAQVRRLLDSGELILQRSARRRKTISLTRKGEQWQLAVPQAYDAARHSGQIAQLITRMERRAARSVHSDAALLERALLLNERYFEDAIAPRSVVWSSAQRERFGSTTTATGDIRISTQLREVPDWVIDSVIVHELAHLREPDHSAEFKKLTARYERTGDADIFLHGFSMGRDLASGR